MAADNSPVSLEAIADRLFFLPPVFAVVFGLTSHRKNDALI